MGLIEILPLIPLRLPKRYFFHPFLRERSMTFPVPKPKLYSTAMIRRRARWN
jgi:hypothetical protein